MGVSDTSRPYVPPRWFVRSAWVVHRGLVRVSRGRLGLWAAKEAKWGTLRLTATGRRSGEPRSVIVGYLEDGDAWVTLAMNGWGAAEPAWWLNLQAHPQARVQTVRGTFDVTASAAEGTERERLWELWRAVDKDLDGYAARRPRETAVVILTPSDRSCPD